MVRMIDWTLHERLAAQIVSPSQVKRVELTVQQWLRELSKQAEKDGHGIASDVFEKAAHHLQKGAI